MSGRDCRETEKRCLVEIVERQRRDVWKRLWRDRVEMSSRDCGETA